MRTATAVICIGLPASGKSTQARDMIKAEPNRWKRINRDDLRAMLDNSFYSAPNEEFVRSVRDQLIIAALRDGFDVICDDTNLVPQTRRKLHRLFESVGNVKVIEMGFNVPIAECVRRNELREGRAKVPQDVIHKMAKASGIDRGKKFETKEYYYPPLDQVIAAYDSNSDLPKAIICDLDGTLAIIGNRSPFDASKCDVLDKPNVAVVECVKAMLNAGYKVVFMSGREDKDREPSIRQIEKYLPGIEYELFMRATGDSRKDSIIKAELFEANVAPRYNVVFILDDRNQVVQGWRNMGLSCFQVAEGNF